MLVSAFGPGAAAPLFVTGPIPPTELGITLALAVLLDATVVRMMLVPSPMKLLGEGNRWIPAWLDKRLPRVHFSH